MKKLKIGLQSKYLYYLLLLITIIYVSINVLFIKKESLYNEHDNYFILKIINIKSNNNGKTITFKGKENLVCFYYDDFPYQLGDYVVVKGNLNAPSNNTVPNLFNYKKYLYNQNVFYILKIEEIRLIKENNNVFYYIKNSIIKKIDKYKCKDYLYAFILGDTSYINSDIKEKYLSLGISHLFAISGMHVSLLISIVSYILNKLKINKYFIFVFNLIFLIIYTFLINFQVSIIRSILSYIFLSINKFTKLKIKNEYIIIFIICIVLLINPFNIYNLGFQYSYLISYVLIKYHNLIKGNYLKKTFIVSVLAFLSSIPITIFNNYQFNLLTIFYNLIYVPLISIIIFPFSLIVFLFPLLENVFNMLIFCMEKITFFLDKFSVILYVKKPDFIIISIYLIIIFYFINGLPERRYYRLIYLFILIIFHYNINSFIKDSYVTVLDVEQGDSILIYHNNKSILVDTGGSFYKDYSDNLISYMMSMGIRKINTMVLSHGDYDHMGEAINLVNNFKVEKVIFNCGEFNELEKELIKVLDKKKIPYYSCIKELNIGDNKLYFLNNKDYGNENDNSSIIYTKLNNYKFLFMGDAGIEVEEDLIEKYNLQDIDVLKVGHHGSKTSSSKSFIDEVNPKYSIISVGEKNRYGHPNKEVLNTLDESNVYRTDQDGSIMFKIKKDKLKIETCSP